MIAEHEELVGESFPARFPSRALAEVYVEAFNKAKTNGRIIPSGYRYGQIDAVLDRSKVLPPPSKKLYDELNRNPAWLKAPVECLCVQKRGGERDADGAPIYRLEIVNRK